MGRHPAVGYAYGVLDGSVPAGPLIRAAVQRHLRDLEEGPARGLRFDRAEAQFALDFFGFLKHSKGEWAGRPFLLEPWQQFIVWCLFGWRRADGFRRFRTAYVEVPRKNGKTQLAAGIGLFLMVADGEPGAEIYAAATKRDQAKICWSEAARMVASSPALARMVRHFRSSNNLSIEETSSKFEPLGADADSLDGLNIHGCVIDELHAHRTREVVDVLETATGARRQPLIFEITTAGSDRSSVCWDHHEWSRQVAQGTIEDDSWFGFVASVDEQDDWTDPEVWAKANPNLGVSVKPEDLQVKADRAQRMPAAQNAFRRLHLDQWTQQTDRWIDLRLWEENAGAPVSAEALAGRLCYGGLDLSSVSDVTAWVLVFPQEGDADGLDILARFWLPEAQLHNDANRYVELYRAWARQGWLTVTPGDAVDYGFVKRTILEDGARFKLRNLNVDRLFQGYQLSQELADEGLEVFGFGLGFLSMAPVTKEFERRLLGKRLHHGGNPVLSWMADNVAVRQDAAGNLKPDKSSSEGKIDGIVALLMALDRAMRHEEKRRSVYETRGLMTVGGLGWTGKTGFPPRDRHGRIRTDKDGSVG